MAEKRRRKSLRLFRPRPETPPISRTSTDSTSSPEKWTPAALDDSDSASPRIRPRTLQKSHRTSIFGSWRSLQSLDEDEKITLTHSESQTSSLQDDKFSPAKDSLGDNVRLYGEVQAPGSSLFKKRTNFLVLSGFHLVRFKNYAKAVEIFPTIPMITSRSAASRSSLSSIGSYSEIQMNMSADVTQTIPLDEIIAVYKLDDGRPFFTLEVSYLDEGGRRASTMQLSFNEPREADSWATAIHSGCAEIKRSSERQLLPQTMEYVVRVLEKERDYDPLHLRVFKVAQRTTFRGHGRLPSEDVGRVQPNICYLAIGINRLHLISIPRISTRSSATSLPDTETSSSYGITALAAIKLQSSEHTCQISLRTPLKKLIHLVLSSFDAPQIALWLRYSSEYLRPEWTVQPFTFDVPTELEEQMDSPIFPVEDNNCFD